MKQKNTFDRILHLHRFIRILSIFCFSLIPLSIFGQISGKVFRDFNSNGVRDSSSVLEEPYTSGIVVKAYNSANVLVATQTSAANGSYSFSGLTLPIRIEFEIPTAANCSISDKDNSAVVGTGNASSVQFITAATSNANFAISNRNESSNVGTDSYLFTPIHIKGDPLPSGSNSGTQTAFVGFPYNPSTGPIKYKLNASQIGSTWGVAYSKQAKKVFTSAFIKRHVGLGPLGSGGIYLLTPTGSTFNVVPFFDMDNNSFNTAANPVTRSRADASAPTFGNGSSFTINSTGTIVTYLGTNDILTGKPSGLGVVGSNADRGLTTSIATPDFDPAAFDQVGKVGLGGLEISDDGKYLFVMNLYSKKVFRLTLDNEYNPTSVIAVDEYTIPTAIANLGEIRPFALKYDRNELFVGAVASAENSAADTSLNLKAYVFRLNNATGLANFTTTPVLDNSLDFKRGAANANTSFYFRPWMNDASKGFSTGFYNGVGNMISHPTPILSDIEITANQDMIIGFTDRSGHQWGHFNYRFLSSANTELIRYCIGGDVLIAGKNCANNTFTLENAGTYVSANGTTYSSGTANGQGPGGSEFFINENLGPHDETSQGALALIPGTNTVVLTVMDPIVFNSGGVKKLSTTTGQNISSSEFQLYATGDGALDYTFAKGNGLGDIELVNDPPSTEIGNRVWFDIDGDGIQDANEAGIANVSVDLLADFDNNGIPDNVANTSTCAAASSLSTASNNACSSGVVWSNPTSALTSNNARATAGLNATNTQTQCLQLTNMNLKVPSNAIIDSVTVAIERESSSASTVRDLTIQLMSGSTLSNNMASTVLWPTNDVIYSYVGDPVTWGLTLTPAIVNASNFGVNIQAERVAGSPTARIDNVTIKICYTIPGNSSGFLATTQTDVNGNWYFNKSNVLDGDYTISDVQNGPQPNKNYIIRIGSSDWSGSNGIGDLTGYALTLANVGGAGQPDVRDNDAVSSSGIPQISYTTGSAGQNNHDIDFGFITAPLCAQPNAGLDMLANAGACINLTAITPLTGTWIAQAGNPSGATIGTTTSGVAQVCFSNLSLGTYSFIYADGSCQDTIQVVVTPKVCLGNFVWNDVNQDGIQNNNELGVSGVTVSLLNGTTNAIISTLNTDAYGFYQFCNLNPGQYKVQFSLPANYIFTGQNAPNDVLDSDPNVFTGITDTYVLAAGDSIMTVDAGIFQPLPVTATVGDRVWFDANNNGIQDIGESGVSGITVTLYNCANPMIPVATTLSDAGGNYLFENVVAGSYQVGVGVPLGMVLTSQSNTVSDATNSDVNPLTERTSCFTVNAGDNIGYVDAGLKLKPALTSSLGDKVWNDANQNGIQDTNETGVQGVVVTLYEQDGVTVIASTTTDGLGNYAFNGINAGCYMIGFSNLPSGYAFSPANVGSDTSKNSDVSISTGKTTIICIASGQNNPTIDAGIFNNSNTNSIGDRVWYDVDQDGIQDVGEYGYPGVVITLYACATNTVMATTTTNANGDYLFSGLGNGDYYVGFGFVPGYQFTGANTDLGGILGSANSDANPSSGFTECVSLTGNTNILTVDAGIYPGNNRNATSTLGDIVWVDVNNNGLQDAGEPGVANVTVTLYESDGTTVLATTTTDGAGEYIFTNLTEGEYVVGFTPSTLPAGYTFTTQGSNIEDENNSDANTTTGKTNNITLGLGEDKLSIDAGIVAPIGTVCLGDYVWIDLDQDGIQDVNEPGVPGVTVKLYDNNTNTILQTATTNAEGKYLFCALSNGSTYSVGFENLPSGFVFTTQSGGLSIPDNSDANATTGRTTTVTLGSSNDLTLDAGIYSTTTAVIGNYVWYDEDADGIQDPTEAPIPGVLVTLYDNTNTPVASAVTDANGGYLFTNVTPGTYTVGFEGYPNTLIPTTKGSTPGADDDSNVDPVTGRTDAFTVTAGSSNLTLDAGYKANPIAGLGNYVWHDMNQNGLQDPNEAPISGVVVTVYASNGTTPLGTAITDGNGAYSFPNLTEGSYIVGFSNLPAGFTRTQNIGGLNDELNSDIDANNLTPLITLQAGLYNPNIDAGFYVGLPLSAQDLKATYVKQEGDNQAIVNWYTEDEENTSMFEVQRSLNGSDFITVGSKAAGGNTLGKTEYALIDDISDLQNVAVLYYRVKMIDLDAGEKMSNTITLKLDNTNLNTIKVYPVPFTNQLTISYQSIIEETVTVEILDMSGRRIVSSEFQLQKGSNTLMIKNLERLSASHYMLRIIPSESEQINVMRLNKLK